MNNISFQWEPAVWMGLIEAVLILAVSFGVPITTEQKTAIIGVSSAVIAVIGSFVVRSQVTPTAKLENK